MKKFFNIYVLAAIASISFVSCDKDNDADTTKPTINLKEPANGTELHIGSDVHFEAEFADDVMLKSYLIDIHNNFDGHTHKAPAKHAEAVEKPFKFHKSYDLSGKRNAHEHHHDIVIDKDAKPGKYHFVIYCTDKAGNQSMVARDIVLSHEAEEHHHHEGEDHDHEEGHNHQH